MKRPALVFLVLSLVFIIPVAFLLVRKPAVSEKGPGLLAERNIGEIASIQISNQHDRYAIYQEEGGFAIADLPMDLVNAEYLLMLLYEAARVEYIETVWEPGGENGAPALYGLDDPQGRAVIRYTTGGGITLVFGDAERVSGGQYFTLEGEGGEHGPGGIYLMDHSRVVRFLQPLKRFINFEIVPFRNVPSPLGAIKNLRLSGRAFPDPIVIAEVRADKAEDMREASSFGAATHLIRSPRLHEIDQKEAVKVFDSLTGLLNIDVLDYNCDDAALAAYGLDDPFVMAEYDFQQDSNSGPLRITLRAARYQDGFIVTRDDQRVVHRIENEAFLSTSYAKLVMRWFLTPFITDIDSIEIDLKGRKNRFELAGEDNRSLEAALNGAKIDTALFRKFYTLLISASNDGIVLDKPELRGPPLLSVTFFYKDPLKKPDTMSFSAGSLRRLYVTVNGITEFACLDRYALTIEAALEALAAGNDFRTDW